MITHVPICRFTAATGFRDLQGLSSSADWQPAAWRIYFLRTTGYQRAAETLHHEIRWSVEKLSVVFCLSLSKERKRPLSSQLSTDLSETTTGYISGSRGTTGGAGTACILKGFELLLHPNMRKTAPNYARPLQPIMRNPCT